jgi:hypothetical protein
VLNNLAAALQTADREQDAHLIHRLRGMLEK